MGANNTSTIYIERLKTHKQELIVLLASTEGELKRLREDNLTQAIPGLTEHGMRQTLLRLEKKLKFLQEKLHEKLQAYKKFLNASNIRTSVPAPTLVIATDDVSDSEESDDPGEKDFPRG